MDALTTVASAEKEEEERAEVSVFLGVRSRCTFILTLNEEYIIITCHHSVKLEIEKA